MNLAQVSVLILGCSGLSAAERLTITIRVLDQAALSESTIHQMEQYIAQPLARMDLRVNWTQCASRPEACNAARGSNEFWLRILPEVPFDAGAELIGFTQPVGIQCVNVIYPRVAELVERLRINAFQALGAAALHEIGHLYLGTNDKAHSKDGIMVGFWSAREIELARQGELQFTDEQALRIRAAVRQGWDTVRHR